MIGIDLGATRTRVAAVNETGRVLALRRCATACEDSFERLMAGLAGMVMEVHDEAYGSRDVVERVAVALPGTLDSDRRVVLRSVNLPLLDGRAIGDELALRIEPSPGTPALFTDAEAATWGEFTSRELPPSRGLQPARTDARDTQTRTCDVFVHLRLGSGVACGVVIDGVLQRLDAGRSTHLDVLVVDERPDAQVCRCGRRGCLETIASGWALQERASGLGCTAGLTGLQRAWIEGDDAARQVIGHAADALQVAISNLTVAFRAKAICIGGGVIAHLPAVWQELTNRRPFGVVRDDPRESPAVEPARLGDNAGVIGAALLVRPKQ